MNLLELFISHKAPSFYNGAALVQRAGLKVGK